MAVTYLRLFPATNQFELKNGALNVAGKVFVYYSETDDLADIFDENGTQLQQPEILDNNGRARGLFVDASKVYRLEVYDQYDNPLYTVRKMVPCGGGPGSALGNQYEIISSDGSISVDKESVGSMTTFDLSVAEDDARYLDWIRCDGSVRLTNTDTYRPVYTSGTMNVGETGILVNADCYYHITVHVRASKSDTAPVYDKVDVLFKLVGDGNTVTNVTRQSIIVDASLNMVQDYEISTDVNVLADAQLVIDILGQGATGVTYELIDTEVHRVYSGIPRIPEGLQRNLIAGEHISITHETAGDRIDTTGLQETLTAGDNIVIANNVISATAAPQVQSDWTENDNTLPSYIQHKPQTKPVVAGQNIVIDETSTQFVISATADPQVQSDWAEMDSTAVDYIKNKPDLSVYATQSDLTTGLATKQDVISDLATIRSGAALGATATQPADLAAGLATKQDVISDLATIRSGAALGATAVQPGSLATVATTGSYNDLLNKPTIVTPVQSDWAESDTTDLAYIQNKPAEKTLVAGTNITITDSASTVTISAASATQVQADWTESDSSDPSYIQNKPDLSVYATTSAMTTALAGKQDVINDLSTIRSGAAAGATAVQPTDLATVATTGDYDDLSNKPTIPAAQVNSDWNAVSGVAQILNKPSLSTVATTGSYNDLTDTPTIPAAQVNSDWNASSGVAQILNKPSLATVATTGDYEDLTNRPTIPAAQVNADWAASSGISEILNKPTLSNVAITGDYADLLNKPTIPTATSDLTNDSGFITINDVPAQVQADWAESDSSDPSYIQNKPSIPVIGYVTVSDGPEPTPSPTTETCPRCGGSGYGSPVGTSCESCGGSGYTYETCPTCGGTGTDPNTGDTCSECGGNCDIQISCDACGGTGYIEETPMCPICEGTGVIDAGSYTQCPDCAGSGLSSVGGDVCPECGGSGMVTFTCGTCEGTGVDPETGDGCAACDATGYTSETCGTCGGSGISQDITCDTCGGTGYIQNT